MHTCPISVKLTKLSWIVICKTVTLFSWPINKTRLSDVTKRGCGEYNKSNKSEELNS